MNTADAVVAVVAVVSVASVCVTANVYKAEFLGVEIGQRARPDYGIKHNIGQAVFLPHVTLLQVAAGDRVRCAVRVVQGAAHVTSQAFPLWDEKDNEK